MSRIKPCSTFENIPGCVQGAWDRRFEPITPTYKDIFHFSGDVLLLLHRQMVLHI